jgi:L,D-peptidoglycan transpeptidase YkuD (ErfK/YbiS/YcfS/YnhG family)
VARLAAALGTVAVASAFALGSAAEAHAVRLSIPPSAKQLVVVSSVTTDPSNYLATLRVYQRANGHARWRRVLGPWPSETGSGHLLRGAQRREGDHATPIGVYGFGATIYGNKPDPGGLHYPYHRLVCGDWWDEDPYSPRYNRFVHFPCRSTPPFASSSEALWTEETAYPYLAVIDYNVHPTISGPLAPGSGIFLHAWIYGPTEGCVALPVAELLHVLRWLDPARHPVIEMGTVAELAHARDGSIL